jgi:glucosamine kinase
MVTNRIRENVLNPFVSVISVVGLVLGLVQSVSSVLILSHIIAPMSFYLAIDAGGTSTRCLLADESRVLARASTGSVKLMRVAEAEATARLQAMLSEAAASAAIPLTHITRTCFGLAGLTIPAVRAWASAAIAAQVSGSLILCGDEEIALDAAFQAGPGILVIAGTGSNVIGRAPDGTLHSAGGWGPVLGDEGGGYWIGLEAVRAALRAQDATPTRLAPDDPSTHLLLEIQRAWNLDCLAELIDLGNHRGDATRPAPDFASLAPVVARCAEQGNPIAAGILHRAGIDLADQVILVGSKLAAATSSNLKPRASKLAVAFTGSVLSHIVPVRESMVARLTAALPAADVHASAVDPLEGALWRARNA